MCSKPKMPAAPPPPAPPAPPVANRLGRIQQASGFDNFTGLSALTIGGQAQGETGSTANIGSVDLANIGEDIPDRPELKQPVEAWFTQNSNGTYNRHTAETLRQELRRDASGKLYWASVPQSAAAQPASYTELK